MESTNYKILSREEPEGGFTMFVPTLEWNITNGKDLKEAKEIAKKLLNLVLSHKKKTTFLSLRLKTFLS